MKNFFNQIPRVWKGGYLIWLSFHFAFLLFSKSIFRYYYYGTREFIFYAVIPILIALIIYYLKPNKEDK